MTDFRKYAQIAPIEERLGGGIRDFFRRQQAAGQRALEAPGLMGRFRRGIVGLPAQVASMPFRAAGGMFGSALMGPRALMGPMRGKRLQPVSGGPGVGLRQIGWGEARDISSGKVPGKVVKGTLGGLPMYYARKYRPGGAVGWAMRHPLLATGGGALAYYLGSNPGARRVASEVMPGVPSRELTPEVAYGLSTQPSMENPMLREAWG